MKRRPHRRLPLAPSLALALSLLSVACPGNDGGESSSEGADESSTDTTETDSEGADEVSTTESETDSETSTESETDTTESSTETDTTESSTESETETETGTETDTDSTTGDEGFGAIVGDCSPLEAELDAATPSLFTLHLDFRDDPYDDPEDLPLLTEGAQTILTTPNAGGSSTVSEAFAYELLSRCAGASLLKTEEEISYDPEDSKKTDILIELFAQKVGVSVTRAVGFPPEDPYPAAQAAGLVNDKLADILVSSANVVAEDAWVKQILVIMAYADMHAELVEAAWLELVDDDPATAADTIVYVVVTDGMDTPLYFN